MSIFVKILYVWDPINCMIETPLCLSRRIIIGKIVFKYQMLGMLEISRRVFLLHHSLICLYDYCVRIMDQQFFLNNMMTSIRGTNLDFNFSPFYEPTHCKYDQPMYEQTFSCSYVEFLALYKVFTLSVQGKYDKCTRVYKGTYVEGFQIFFKNYLAHFPFVRMGDIPHKKSLITHSSLSFFSPRTCSLDNLPH